MRFSVLSLDVCSSSLGCKRAGFAFRSLQQKTPHLAGFCKILTDHKISIWYFFSTYGVAVFATPSAIVNATIPSMRPVALLLSSLRLPAGPFISEERLVGNEWVSWCVFGLTQDL